ncbi:PREDICTED: uncharacterized protein LOC109590534 isoform X2 [Amphimedon queenslandica]|uniref:Fibronectin type-III domain-containing protein n=1 Tax=Amphimedon queenslandica TaxID=400682 RepID=A0AAN0JY16_AMPQE|nr:PREDICTED: uncharacterized protein LOC109590534 isoform X2 [Amphimedon queenslandica]|eukprot:XP_019861996.1 PREDICTED: uncharacterized protein LOC109590534 isoform X2 [Amphimedon queenslandica]
MMAAFTTSFSLSLLVFVIFVLASWGAVSSTQSCSDLAYDDSCGDDGPKASQLLRYDKVQCHSGGEAVSVAWSTNTSGDSAAEDSSITLEYTCYVNESKVSDFIQYFSKDLNHSSLITKSEVFPFADYCVFSGCISYDDCWYNMSTFVNRTCRNDLQTSSEVISSSSEVLIQSSSNVAQQSILPIIVTSTVTESSMLTSSFARESHTTIKSESISNPLGTSSSYYATSLKASPSSLPPPFLPTSPFPETIDPVIATTLTAGLAFLILLVFVIIMLILLSVGYWRRYNKRRDEEEPYYIPSLDLKSDYTFIELGASTLSIVTVIQDLQPPPPAAREKVPLLNIVPAQKNISNVTNNKLLPESQTDDKQKLEATFIRDREQSCKSLSTSEEDCSISISSTDNINKMKLLSLASSTDSGFTNGTASTDDEK